MVNKIIVKKSKIIENIQISKDTFLLKIFLKEKFFPTQFLMIDTYPKRFLLKPFTVADYDEKRSVVTMIYRVVGEGTEFLSQKNIGEEIKFVGPFGNLEKIKDVEKKLEQLQDINNRIFLLAGGSGIASVIYLYKWLSKKFFDIKTFYGEKDKRHIIDLKMFGIKNVVYTTDNGTYGKRGFVGDVFIKEIKKFFNNNNFQITVFVCGPKPMLETLQKILCKHKNVICYVLLEEYMCCGVGICRSCVVKIKNKFFEYQSVCKDGPMFNLKKIIF